MNKERWIRASEIQSFSYCARSWWLQHSLGLEPEDYGQLVGGAEQHQVHGRRVVRSAGLRQVGLLLMLIALLLAAIALLRLLGGA